MNALSGSRPEDVVERPFAHLVVHDALDQELLTELCESMPAIRGLAGRDWLRSNRRGNVPATAILSDDRFPQVWREFVGDHVGQDFLGDVVRVMGPSIAARYPDFITRYGSLTELRAGIRGDAEGSAADVRLDALLGFNTPVRRRPSRVRGPHLDMPDKLFAGLLYLRDPDDDSTGGAFEIYEGDPLRVRHDHRLGVDDRALCLRATVEYERNTLVLFLNSPEAFHAVSPRRPTPHPRMFINFVGELAAPLFETKVPRRSGLGRTVAAASRRFWQSSE